MQTTAPLYNLSEVVEQFLMRKFNDRRKYFSKYLSIAQDVYKELYRKILPSTVTKAMEVIYDDNEPYPYIEVPENMERFYGIWIPNKRGELIQALYNERLNVFPKPVKKKKCGCVTNDLCNCIDNLQLISTPKEIDGTIFIEKQWLQCCANGDVMEYRETPVKSYGTEGGSYSNDYSNDYDIIATNGTIVTIKYTKKLGKLDTKPCGCVIENDHNNKMIYETCGCYLGLKTSCCKQWYKKTHSCTGQYKFSECGTKIYLVDVRTESGFVYVSFQHNGVTCGEEVMIDDYVRSAIWFGIEYQSTIFFPAASQYEKEQVKNNFRKAETDLFEYVNPINQEKFFSVTAELIL